LTVNVTSLPEGQVIEGLFDVTAIEFLAVSINDLAPRVPGTHCASRGMEVNSLKSSWFSSYESSISVEVP